MRFFNCLAGRTQYTSSTELSLSLASSSCSVAGVFSRSHDVLTKNVLVLSPKNGNLLVSCRHEACRNVVRDPCLTNVDTYSHSLHTRKSDSMPQNRPRPFCLRQVAQLPLILHVVVPQSTFFFSSTGDESRTVSQQVFSVQESVVSVR